MKTTTKEPLCFPYKSAKRDRVRNPMSFLQPLQWLLALLLAISFFPMSFASCADSAYANLNNPPETLSGKFTLDPSFTCTPSYTNSAGGFPGSVTLNGGYTVVSFGSNDSGNNGRILCVSPGAANWGDPSNLNNRGGDLQASWHHNDEAQSIAWYRISVTPDKQPAVGVFGVQYLGDTWLAITWEFGGLIELQKTSSDLGISANNSCYSLAGATYGIYRSSEHAYADSGRIGTLITDTNGYAKSKSILGFGTYFVKEIQAPPGYLLNPQVYQVAHNSSITRTETTDEPQKKMIDRLVQKTDSQTGISVAQGAASLRGAEFTVRFYAGSFDVVEQAEASGTLARTWVLKTDANGNALLTNSHKVSGDPFYYTAEGEVLLPLGTLVVVETKAPAGYNLDDGAGGKPIPHLIRIDAQNDAESPSLFQPAPVPDSVKRGDYRLIKMVPSTLDERDQSLTKLPVEGIEFTFTLDNPGKENHGQTIDSATRREWRIKTDANGYADTTGLHSGNDISVPGALPYGTYIVQEIVPPEVFQRFKEKYGIALSVLPPWKITISKNRQFDAVQLVENTVTQSAIKIIKTDAETGERISSATTFRIYDSQSQLVTYTSHYPEEIILDEWTTLNGCLTLPMKLMPGLYCLEEVVAPEGYALAAERIPFEVPENQSFNWDDPLEVEFSDFPIKGSLEIVKSDAATKRFVVDAEYCVAAFADIVTPDGTIRIREGEVVASGLKTDENGIARVDDLYLGVYQIQETQAPSGYALDTEKHEIAIVSSGQEVPVVSMCAAVENSPSCLRLLKYDSDTGKPLAGATFRVKKERDPSASPQDDRLAQDEGMAGGDEGNEGEGMTGGTGGTGGTGVDDEGDSSTETETGDGDSALEKEFDVSLTSDEEGNIFLDYLEPGTYSIIETQAPQGYSLPLDAEPIFFTVNEQGLIEGEAAFTVSIPNSPIKPLITTPEPKKSIPKSGDLFGVLFACSAILGACGLTGGGFICRKLLQNRKGKLL